MLPPRREEGAHGQRPFAAAGGGRAGTGSRGILERSGAELAGLTRPPSAWLRAKGCVLAWSGSSSSIAGTSGNGSAQVPVRPEQGHPTGRWRITAARSVRASSKRYLQTHTPDDVRRSASLSRPSASDRVKWMNRVPNPPPSGGGVGSKRRRRGKRQGLQDFPLRRFTPPPPLGGRIV